MAILFEIVREIKSFPNIGLFYGFFPASEEDIPYETGVPLISEPSEHSKQYVCCHFGIPSK